GPRLRARPLPARRRRDVRASLGVPRPQSERAFTRDLGVVQPVREKYSCAMEHREQESRAHPGQRSTTAHQRSFSMKTTLKTLACAAAIAAFAGAPIAIGQQQRDTRQPQQPDRQQTTDRMQTPARTPDTARAGMFDLKLERASELMGTNVHGANGDKIGDIADFVVSTRTGRIDSVLINTGAILGVGGKEIRVPFHSLNWNPAEERLQTSMT